MKNSKKVLVLGASSNTERYSFMATSLLKSKGHQVFAIGNKKGLIDTINIVVETTPFEDIHTVTLYLSAKNQLPYYDYIIGLNPKRVIFNPGTENPELEKLLSKNNIPFEESCTLVLLSTNQF